jgi:hypothetical protein
VTVSSKGYLGVIVPAMLLALSACGGDKSGNASGGLFGQSKSDEAESKKLNTYTEGSNFLLGGAGISGLAESYAARDIPSKSASDDISVIEANVVKLGLGKLKEARAMSGGPEDLDKAADTLIAAIEKLQARYDPLAIYYKSKAYKEDNLARGKQEDAALTADFKTAIDAQKAFDTLLKRDRDAQTEKDLVQLKKDGDTLGYATKSAVQKAERLVGLFNKPEDLQNAQLFAQADGLVGEIDKLLVEQRAAYAKAKSEAKSQIEAPSSSFERVDRELTDMIGNYREMKQTKDVDDVNDMVESYNDAVSAMNMIRR